MIRKLLKLHQHTVGVVSKLDIQPTFVQTSIWYNLSPKVATDWFIFGPINLLTKREWERERVIVDAKQREWGRIFFNVYQWERERKCYTYTIPGEIPDQ